MNLQLPPELKDLDINFITILFGIYIITVGIAYYFIYHKHHKKNKIELDELISLVAKFYVTTTITIIAILVGIVCIIFANEFKDNRADVIFRVLMGIVIITVAIINFVFYSTFLLYHNLLHSDNICISVSTQSRRYGCGLLF